MIRWGEFRNLPTFPDKCSTNFCCSAMAPSHFLENVPWRTSWLDCSWWALMFPPCAEVKEPELHRTSIQLYLTLTTLATAISEKCSQVVESEAVSWPFQGCFWLVAQCSKGETFGSFCIWPPQVFASRSQGIANPLPDPPGAGRPLRNIHPCAYDAYGMTCVEAAACAVASAMGEGVGAKALLEDATLTLQMPKEVGMTWLAASWMDG